MWTRKFDVLAIGATLRISTSLRPLRMIAILARAQSDSSTMRLSMTRRVREIATDELSMLRTDAPACRSWDLQEPVPEGD